MRFNERKRNKKKTEKGIELMIEQKFFKAFEIEKRHIIFEDDYGQYQTRDKMYPKITAEILLELIVILSKWSATHECCYLILVKSIEELKKRILEDCIEFKEELDENEVKALFEEE